MENPAEVLAAHLHVLTLKDQEFAQSLLSQLNAKGTLTPKQTYWLNVLARRADKLAASMTDKVGEAVLDVGGFGGVVQLLATPKASGKIKAPRLTFHLPVGQRLVLALIGPGWSEPSIVTLFDDKPKGRWFGRVDRAGLWQLSSKVTDEVMLDQIHDLLVQLAARPLETIMMHGRRVGRCCFCDRPFANASAAETGYGAGCAKKWGLMKSTWLSKS